MSEEHFWSVSDGPIGLRCDAVFMEYVVTLMKQGVTRDLEKALINSIETKSLFVVGFFRSLSD